MWLSSELLLTEEAFPGYHSLENIVVDECILNDYVVSLLM